MQANSEHNNNGQIIKRDLDKAPQYEFHLNWTPKIIYFRRTSTVQRNL